MKMTELKLPSCYAVDSIGAEYAPEKFKFTSDPEVPETEENGKGRKDVRWGLAQQTDEKARLENREAEIETGRKRKARIDEPLGSGTAKGIAGLGIVGLVDLHLVVAAFFLLDGHLAGAVFGLLSEKKLPGYQIAAAIMLVYFQAQSAQEINGEEQYGKMPDHNSCGIGKQN
jgi:hypothetical protein